MLDAHLKMMHNDTIVALATPSGSGAIAVIRLSGNEALTIADKNFKHKYAILFFQGIFIFFFSSLGPNSMLIFF